MGNSTKPHNDDQDDNGIPDSAQSPGQGQGDVHSGQDMDGDGAPEGDRLSSNPIIINR